MGRIKPGVYRHYKGDLYEVYGVATHTETEELFVVYRSLYGSYRLNIRPLEMFVEEVEWESKKIPRFELIKEY